MNKDKKLLIVCECGSCEHQFILNYIAFKDHPMLSLETHLITWESFFKRLWVGLKYAFGYKSKYGHFDDVIINKDEAKKIRDFFAEVGYLTEVEIK
jgi:hypothetical protein